MSTEREQQLTAPQRRALEAVAKGRVATYHPLTAGRDFTWIGARGDVVERLMGHALVEWGALKGREKRVLLTAAGRRLLDRERVVSIEGSSE